MITRPKAKRRTGLYATASAITGVGLWAFVSPSSFFDVVAPYPPYNEHLFHDAGAFLTGLGSALFIATRYRDGLTVAIGANAVGAAMHALAHIIDRDAGGRASDPWLLSLVAISLGYAALKRMRRSS